MSPLRRAPAESSRLVRLLIVLAGIVLGQAVLYGPSLTGLKLLLPLDVLNGSHVYLPPTPERPNRIAHDEQLSDLIYMGEPMRRFAISELRAGRLPMWNPYYFAGAPVGWPKFSPFLLLTCCTESPVILAWSQLLTALVAGLGAYAFCRRVLGVRFWAAALAAWCYPLTGFFVLWEGYTVSLPVCWLPWLLLAVERTVRHAESQPAGDERNQASPSGIAPLSELGRWGSRLTPVGLSVVTSLVLVSGQLDIAGQVLLVSGIYAVWRIVAAHGRQWLRGPGRRAAMRLAAGWGLGILLATPYWLPAVEYARTGVRVARRSAGAEERPPMGFSGLPLTVLPHANGALTGDSIPWTGLIPCESPAAGYVGVAATLLFAPLAWRSRRHRAFNWFWAFLALFALSWSLNLPGFVQLLRLPGMNLMSHNRLVFAFSFAVIALLSVGLDVLLGSPLVRRWWYCLPAVLVLGLGVWCVYRAQRLPEPIASQLGNTVAKGDGFGWVRDADGVRRVQAWFVEHSLVAAAWCGAALGVWALLWFRPGSPSRWGPIIGGLLVGELIWFAHERYVQSDPALYYPRIPVLEDMAKASPDRMTGAVCLPANLPSICGLRDVRGYDAVDPAEFMDIMTIIRDPLSPLYTYSSTQWMAPTATIMPDGAFRFSPLLDMLAVRFVVARDAPPPQTKLAFQGPDYWVITNTTVLPRPYVPKRVEVVADAKARLGKLAAPAFDPREVAYTEESVELPASCRGTAVIVDETPTRISVAVRMETPGLVVLADRWDRGWKAYLDGKRVPILRTNHAIRGVVVPTGKSRLEFRYAPASFTWGVSMAGIAAVVLLGWLRLLTRKPRSV